MKTFNKIKDIFNIIVEKIQNKRKFYKESWKLYLYFKGQCIAVKRIDKDYTPMNKLYVVDVQKMKHLFGTNKKTKIIVQSFKYKYSDEKKKEVHIETLLFEGVDINE